MRIPTLLAGLLILAGCTAQPGSAPTALAGDPMPGNRGLAKDATEAVPQGAQSQELILLTRLPEALAEIPRVSLVERQVEGVLNAAVAAYRAPGFSVTVYLIRRSAGPVPEEPNSLPVLSELLASTTAARSQGAEVLGARDQSRLVQMQLPGAAQPILCNHDTYPRPNLSVQDFTCASVLDGRLLTVRATFGMLAGQHERAQRAMSGLMILIRGHLSGAPPAARTTTIRL